MCKVYVIKNDLDNVNEGIVIAMQFANTGRIRIIRNDSLPTFLFELSGIFELK